MYLLIIACLPVFLVALYIYKKDVEKEPIKLLIKILLRGVVACFIVFGVNMLLAFTPFYIADITKVENASILLYAYYTFVQIALLEESSKFIMFYEFTRKHKEFDTTFDMIVYAAYASLGFALFENILYVFIYGASTGLLRAVTSIPLHAMTGVFMGYFLGKNELESMKTKSKNSKYLIYALLTSIFIHGLYDFGCYLEMELLVYGILIGGVILSITIINKSRKNDKRLRYIDNLCPYCKTPITGRFCSNCGKQLYK